MLGILNYSFLFSKTSLQSMLISVPENYHISLNLALKFD